MREVAPSRLTLIRVAMYEQPQCCLEPGSCGILEYFFFLVFSYKIGIIIAHHLRVYV